MLILILLILIPIVISNCQTICFQTWGPNLQPRTILSNTGMLRDTAALEHDRQPVRTHLIIVRLSHGFRYYYCPVQLE